MNSEQAKEILRKLRLVEIRTNRLVNDSLAGEYHSVFKGRGMDFDEVREYVPGEEVRAIDWNVNARAGRPFTTTTPGPSQAKAWAPNGPSANPTLTPATPMSSHNPPSSREDIRYIRQPRHLPTPLAWAAVVAGVIILSATSPDLMPNT